VRWCGVCVCVCLCVGKTETETETEIERERETDRPRKLNQNEHVQKEGGWWGWRVCVSIRMQIQFNSFHQCKLNLRVNSKTLCVHVVALFFSFPTSRSLPYINNQIILQRFFWKILFQLSIRFNIVSILFNPPHTHQGLSKIIDEQLQNNMRDGSGDFSFTAVLNKLQTQSVTLG